MAIPLLPQESRNFGYELGYRYFQYEEMAMSLEIRESDTAIIKAAPHLFVRSGILEGVSEALKTGHVTLQSQSL